MHYRRLDQLFFQTYASPVSVSSPFALQIGRFTLQRVHSTPNVYIIDNFLNAAELQYMHTMIAASTHQFQRSYVDAARTTGTGADSTPTGVTTGDSQYDTSHRTSTFVSFAPHQDSKCAAIETKAAELLGCYSSAKYVEPLQLVRYRKGQFFGVHHDLGDYNADTGTVELPPKSLFAKRRIVTLFCYLNDVSAGGATHFPSLTTDHHRAANNKTNTSATQNDTEDGLRVEPVPGRAVLFSNITVSGQPDVQTIHAGEPVKDGVKYGLNIWICEG